MLRPTSTRPLLLALALGSLSLASCSAISAGMGEITGSNQKKEQAELVARVQAEVMSFADVYVGQLMDATATIPTPTAQDQVVLLGFQARQASAAYEIASSNNPLANVVDMAILATLTRTVVQTHWIPETFHDAGQPLLEALTTLEPKVWMIADEVMEKDQKVRLQQFIAGWVARYPQVRDVSSVRIADLSAVASGSTGGLGTTSELLKSFGLDLFGGLDPAVAEVQQSRVLAERAFYFAKRWPRLLEIETRLLALQLALQPAPTSLLADVNRVSLAAESVARTAEGLPALADREREAAIRQVLDAMEAQEGRARALLAEMRRTLNAGTGAANAVHGALASLDTILGTMNAPSPPGTPPSKPFDVNDYTRALEQLGRSATELEALLRAVNQDSPRVAALIGDAGREVSERGRALVELAFRRAVAVGLLLILSVLVAALVYRWAANRMNRANLPAGRG
jgi:hypothetical protein